MSLLGLALLLSLSSTPCRGEHVVLVPFQAVALSAAEARQVEDAVRKAAEATSGVCLEPRAETVAKLRARGGRLSACWEAACRGAQVSQLGAEREVRGLALGVGGGHSVALTLVDRGGLESHATVQLSGDELPPGLEDVRAREAFASLWAHRLPPVEVKKASSKVLPTVLVAAGGVALAAGIGFGLAARKAETALSSGTGGCAGQGEDFRTCFAGKLQAGRQQALAANALFGAGAVLGAGGAVFFLWELP